MKSNVNRIKNIQEKIYLLVIQKVFREEIYFKGWIVQSERKHFSNVAFKYSQS